MLSDLSPPSSDQICRRRRGSFAYYVFLYEIYTRDDKAETRRGFRQCLVWQSCRFLLAYDYAIRRHR